MPEFDPYRRSYEVLHAALDVLASHEPDNDQESWATAVVVLRSPLANGSIDGPQFGYICATVAAAAITDAASVRRAARIRMYRYGGVFYALSLGSAASYKLLPASWITSPFIGGAIGVLHAIAAHLLARRALRPFKPTPPAAAEVDHG